MIRTAKRHRSLKQIQMQPSFQGTLNAYANPSSRALEQDAKKWEPVFRIDPALTFR
jgi:hypothetical protein